MGILDNINLLIMEESPELKTNIIDNKITNIRL